MTSALGKQACRDRHTSYVPGMAGFTRPTTDFLADRFGLDDQPSAAFAGAMAALTPMASVRDYVGEVALSSIWLTGYALGVLRAERSPVAGQDPVGPLVAAALASLAPGGLRRFLARPLLARLAGPVGGFAAEAVRHGCEAYATRRREIILRHYSERAVVTPQPSPLCL
jgi:hypothetical protein